MQMLQICWLLIHDENLLFHCKPKVIYFTEIRSVWRPFKYIELIVMFKLPILDDLCFMTWCVILLEEDIRRWVHCGHKEMVSKLIERVGCGFDTMFSWYLGA